VNQRLPFTLDKQSTFYEQLGNWVGDVFYDILPEAGFELRDEQVYMGFQLERAYKEKNVIFAEAGVGTGKTLVYLLYSICVARYTGKPAIIACADDLLIEQLVKPNGDIEKLSKALGLDIDARLAKSQEHYLCLEKLDKERAETDTPESIHSVFSSLPSFVRKQEPMQTFQHYGDRKEYADLTDAEWKKVNWDPFQDCFSCPQRQRCGLTLTRDHYRKAKDLIICSHDFFMEHVWTYDARIREGQLPLLPDASSIVFDEGHLLETAAQKALTYRVKTETLENLLERLLKFNVREEFAYIIEDTLTENILLFDLLGDKATDVVGSERKDIKMDDELLQSIHRLHKLLDKIGNELVIESEVYVMEQYEQRVVEEYLDSVEKSLSFIIHDHNAIYWLEEQQGQHTLVLMPRKVEEILHEHVFSKKIPIIFSSATLSENESFALIASTLGIEKYLSFSVESPFDYENNMQVTMPILKKKDMFNDKLQIVQNQLSESEGRALLLFPSFEELEIFKRENQQKSYSFEFLFEGDAERSQLVRQFQENENSVLCSTRLWEGLDIPGPSLSHVIIWALPFPPVDPVFNAKRNDSQDPFWDVDVPYMLLRLRQGIGRLIRTSSDKGSITILSERIHEDPVLFERVKAIFPKGVRIDTK
jgi:ATP-dependent DNA helicase DinG